MNQNHFTLVANKSVFFLFLCFLSACAWEDIGIEPTSFAGESPDIPTFSNYKEFLSQSHELFAKTQEEIVALETQKGFKSFGRMADEVYERAVDQNFNSVEEIEKFVEENSQFWEISIDEYGERSLERTIPDRRYRYLINSERLFQVGDMVYKVFKDKIVSAQSADVDKLRKISDSDKNADIFSGLDVQDLRHQVSAVQPVYCPNNNDCADWKTVENGNERVRIKLCLQSASYTNTVDSQQKYHSIGSLLEAKAQKKSFGIWIDAKRTITTKYKASVDYNFGSGWERACWDHMFYSNSPQWSVSIAWPVTGYVASTNAPSYHFSGKDSWAKIPGPTTAQLICNASSICVSN